MVWLLSDISTSPCPLKELSVDGTQTGRGLLNYFQVAVLERMRMHAGSKPYEEKYS